MTRAFGGQYSRPYWGSVPNGPSREPSARTTSACAIVSIAAFETLISKRADGELVVVRKRIVVQIRRCDGSAEEFGKFARLRERVACNDAAAGKDHRIPCVGERFGGGRDLSGVSGAAFERQRRIDFGEEVA